jgi:hypothetical protein
MKLLPDFSFQKYQPGKKKIPEKKSKSAQIPSNLALVFQE